MRRVSNPKKYIMNVRLALSLLSPIVALLFFVDIAHASDATIYLSPVTATFTMGEPVVVKVFVGTGGENINAVEGKL